MTDELRTGALNVITTVKYDVDLINAINRMTFLFDPNWQAIGNTLPLSFFFVKDFKEVMDTEVSQKTLLFYNSQNGNNKDAVAGSLLGVVSDNIINKPKKYQMTIIIPRNIDIYLKQYTFSNRVSFSSLFRTDNEVDKALLTGAESLTYSYMVFLDTFMKVLGSTAVSFSGNEFSLDIKTWWSNMVAGIMDDSNKASIDAMWENRTILRMKYWNGWQFKYVAIESYVPSKQGEVTDFYEATLNLTEVPIMTMRKGGDFRIPKMSALASILLSGKSKLSSTVISEFLDKLENGKILGK